LCKQSILAPHFGADRWRFSFEERPYPCHEDVMRALQRRDSAAVRRAIERDLFVAGQFLRARFKPARKAGTSG
jgi:hypothetical protein